MSPAGVAGLVEMAPKVPGPCRPVVRV